MISNYGRALVLILGAGLAGCSGTADVDNHAEETVSLLVPEAFLAPGCVNWPAEDFSQSHNAGNVRTSVAVGESAIDFTLRDPSGTPHSLSELLETKPVFMVFGAFT